MRDRDIPTASPTAFRASAGLGLLGVALGAFGAHGLKDVLTPRNMVPVWEKAVLYHLVHAVVMLLIATLRPFPAVAWRFFGVGILCFSGSLYIWALTGIYWMVFVTPVGGICLLLGWLWLALDRGRPVESGASNDLP